METILTNLGTKIRTTRMELGLSQEQLSEASGVQRSQISKIESGMIDVQLTTLEKVSNALNVPLPFLLTENFGHYDIHPFVKWAGGKTQLLDVIESHMPSYFNSYFEPFVGGGALFFKIQPKKAYINDFNDELVCVYKCLGDNEYFEKLKELLTEHENKHSEEYYYMVREQDKDEHFLELPIYVRAARMIYLNKTCFNGLYRVNSKGFFNVPSGKKTKVNCFDRKCFDDLNSFFKNANINISSGDFEKILNKAKAGDFVYFDPPYDTWEDKDSFTDYGKGGFGKEEQARLAKCYRALAEKGVFVMLSNHNTKYINELYKGFHINVVPAKRMINSKASGRGEVEEVLITNYE